MPAPPYTWPDMGLTPAEQLDKLAVSHPTVDAQLEALHAEYAEYAELLARAGEIETTVGALRVEIGPIEQPRRVVSGLIRRLQDAQR